jgi:hypothetical protein
MPLMVAREVELCAVSLLPLIVKPPTWLTQAPLSESGTELSVKAAVPWARLAKLAPAPLVILVNAMFEIITGCMPAAVIVSPEGVSEMVTARPRALKFSVLSVPTPVTVIGVVAEGVM